MPLKILPASGSGSATLISVAGTTTNDTLTLPARTGNIITSADTGTVTQAMIQNGNSSTPLPGIGATGPAFAAYRNGPQTVTSGSYAKVQFNAEFFDTNNNFDSTTNYRFTPTVAGYYQVNTSVGCETTTSTSFFGVQIRKNVDTYAFLVSMFQNGNMWGAGSDLIYMNGSTDYLEIWARVDGAGTLGIQGSDSARTHFSASLVRAA